MAQIVGDANANSITGTTSDEQIRGLGGNDTLQGGGGEDTLEGGVGDDMLRSLFADDAADVLSGGGGDDNIGAEMFNAQTNTANGLVHTLLGGAGDDSLGATGQCVIDGGEGIDVVSVALRAEQRTTSDSIDLRLLDDHETVVFGGGISLTNVESGAIVLLGNFDDVVTMPETLSMIFVAGFGDDLLNGGAMNDSLDGGGGGDDTVFGGGGDDLLAGGNQDRYADLLQGGDGDDRIGGRRGADRLYGEEGKDTLYGGKGDDSIHGGAGKDRLRGNGGADVYVFDQTAMEGPADTIIGLREVDQVDLSAIDADTTLGGDQVFVLVSAFTGQAGQLVLEEVGNRNAFLHMDVDGDGEADATIKLADSKDYAEMIDLVLVM